MEYLIKFVDTQSQCIVFSNHENDKTFNINYMDFNDYCKVHDRHYYNSEKNEVIIVDNEAKRNGWRAVSIEFLRKEITIDNKIYTKCTQCQFDKWHAKIYPNTHNAKVYNLLIKNLQ